MSQIGLFDRSALPIREQLQQRDPWEGARWYQVEACKALLEGWDTDGHRSQLAVLATGLGKSVIAGLLARYWLQEGRGNVLMLANRDELVQQGAGHLSRMCGEVCEIDQAGALASRKARLVMGSIDTVKQQHRLDRYGKDHFSLIIADEAQHWAGNTYMRPLDFFSDAKILGLTATPDRADERALGKTFDAVGYVRDILQGIEDGYLVPLDGTHVELKEITLDGIKAVAGDLLKGQLDEVMVRAVEGIVSKTLELQPQRRAIGFFPGVKSAEYATERFNVLEPGSTGFISAKTEENVRRQTVADYKSGKLKRLMNVGICIEGFDAPQTDLIIHGRPTLSRMFYAQATGRGTRVLPGTVDHLIGAERAAERVAAVAASAKPNCWILDFVGNSTKHDLMTPHDLLGGDFSDEEVALAKKKSKEGAAGNVKQQLEAARRELAAVAAAVRSKVTASARSFNPFAVLDIDLSSTTRDDMRWGRLPATEKQKEALGKMKVPPGAIASISEREAKKLIAERNKRHDQGLATYAQLAQLKRYGLDDKDVSFKNAGRALTYVAQTCNWKPERVDVKQLSWLASGGA